MTAKNKKLIAAALFFTYVILLYTALELSKGRVWKGAF